MTPSWMVDLEAALPEIGYEPLSFLRDFLDGGDVPPVYRTSDGRLGLDRSDVAAWRGKARVRALQDLISAPRRVINAGALND